MAKRTSTQKFNRDVTIDDFKGTKGNKIYYELCEKASKARKNKTFFALNGGKK